MGSEIQSHHVQGQQSAALIKLCAYSLCAVLAYNESHAPMCHERYGYKVAMLTKCLQIKCYAYRYNAPPTYRLNAFSTDKALRLPIEYYGCRKNFMPTERMSCLQKEFYAYRENAMPTNKMLCLQIECYAYRRLCVKI